VIFITGGAWVLGCDCFSVVILVLLLLLFSFFDHIALLPRMYSEDFEVVPSCAKVGVHY
jgi:hypothetical protein